MIYSASASAHHAFAADFDANKRGIIEGVIKESFFKNPHIKYYVEVTDKDGGSNIWVAASMSPNMLRGMGWNKKSFSKGDKITIEGVLGRNGSKNIWIKQIENEDGSSRFDMEAGEK